MERGGVDEGTVVKNLLKETERALAVWGKSGSDARWVGSSDGTYGMTWDEFKSLADQEYDDNYCDPQVATDLVIVGDGWWLERWEFGGTEGWTYKTRPTLLWKSKPITRVIVTAENPYDNTLKEMNP